MDWESGDLVTFWGREPISRAIETFTRGPSHIGLMCAHPNTGAKLLWESTTLTREPDCLTGEHRSGFQAHLPEARIAEYGGRAKVLRLVDGEKLWRHEREFLGQWLAKRHAQNPAYNYRGALMSALLLRWTHMLPYPDMHSVFCSQITARALMRFNKVARRNCGVYNPASLVREVLANGTYEILDVTF